jgi:phenol hydroxylase P0 protein
MEHDQSKKQFSELTRYVRVRRVVNDQFIEFDFAIDDPSLYVEMILPKSAFDAFCQHNKVVMMTDEQAAAVDADMEKWRYGKDHSNP